jgi:hypothetical protein
MSTGDRLATTFIQTVARPVGTATGVSLDRDTRLEGQVARAPPTILRRARPIQGGTRADEASARAGLRAARRGRGQGRNSA